MKVKEVDFCFVISDLLSTTPRAYRAIRALLEQGYSVHLSFNTRRFEALTYHNELISGLKKFNFSYSEIIWTNRNISSVFHKIIHKLVRKIIKPNHRTHKVFLLYGVDYTFFRQYNRCKNVQARVYAAHRPGSIPVISELARKHKAKAWFDIEDQHFVESTDTQTNQWIEALIKKFSAAFNYTNASEPIGRSYMQYLKQETESIEILNSPIIEKELKVHKNNTIRFLWFSQTVTFNRGLEYFFEALKKKPLKCQINLVGTVDEKFRKYIENLSLGNHVKVVFHGFIPENKINELAFNSDVGLALELDNVDKSRDLAITNKILTYALSGCYILATKTTGQINFLGRLPENGILIEKEKFSEYFHHFNIEKIRSERGEHLKNAEQFSWQTQKEKLLEFAENLLK